MTNPKNKVFLTEEQDAYLRENYSHTLNRDLCRELGVTKRTLVRLARERGLVKDMAAIEEKRIEVVRKGVRHYYLTHKHATNHLNGVNCRFKKGYSAIEKFGEEKFREMHRKTVETRKKRFAEERARATFGLPQLTKMRVKRQPRQKIMDRSYLKRRGYILDEVNNIAYWTDSTRRATRMEKFPKRRLYYTFKPYEGCGSD